MSAETKPHEPAPDAKEPCPNGEVRNSEGVCVPDPNPQAGASAESAEKGMFLAVKGVLKDALEEMRKETLVAAKAMMETELAKIQKEFAIGLRKELGLTTDPTVTKTELHGAVRKAMLDLKIGDGKKTPASEPLAKSAPKTDKPGDIFKKYGVI